VQGILGAPLIWAGASPVLTYNILLMLGLALTGWSTCLVMTGWTGSRAAGVLSGSLIAFNAMTLTRFAEIQDQYLVFFAPALWALDRLLAHPRVKHALALAGWFALQALTCGYLLAFVALSLVASVAVRPAEWLGPRLRRVAPLLLLAAATAVLALHRGPYWNRELAALSPVPLEAQRIDAQLRAELGAAEAGALVAVSADSQEAALRAAEQAGTVLDALRESGAIGGYDSAALFLPSQAAQRVRREALPPPRELRQRTRVALAQLPLSLDKLEPFFRDVEAARNAAPLTRASLDGTSFASAFDALCNRAGGRHQALLPLHAPAQGALDLRAVRAAFAAQPIAGLEVLDLKQASNDLYGAYLREALRLSALGLAAICLLLALTLRDMRQLLRVLAPLFIAVTVCAALLVLAGQQLTILHLIGMLLVVAIGSNYALFFARMDSASTLASLLIANLCTVIAFGILASSEVPVLGALGRTVAPGALLALGCSALL